MLHIFYLYFLLYIYPISKQTIYTLGEVCVFLSNPVILVKLRQSNIVLKNNDSPLQPVY
jgi:hypothetical protein